MAIATVLLKIPNPFEGHMILKKWHEKRFLVD